LEPEFRDKKTSVKEAYRLPFLLASAACLQGAPLRKNQKVAVRLFYLRTATLDSVSRIQLLTFDLQINYISPEAKKIVGKRIKACNIIHFQDSMKFYKSSLG
jgi:hypothetical protein